MVQSKNKMASIYLYFKRVTIPILSFFLLVILGPIVLTVYIPFFIYRQCVVLLSKLLRPDLISIVRARDTVMANDDFETVPKSTILLLVVLEGDIELEYLRNKVLVEMVEARIGLGKNLKYPELQQYFVPWLGYLFKKWEAKFDISEHVTLWKADEVSETDLYTIRRNLLQAPYASGRSPWEIILVRNYRSSSTDQQQRSVAIGKFHHGVVDGYSLLKIFINSVKTKTKKSAAEVKPSFIRRSILQRACFLLKAIVMAPYTLMEQAPNFQAGNIFDPTKVKIVGKRHPVSTDIPVSSVKSISRNTQTCFVSVLLAGLSGGIRNYLDRNGQTVPQSIDVSIPLPWPGHPSRIRNSFTFAALDLPVGIPDSHERLQNLHRKIRELKKSVVPAVNFGLVPLTGSLPCGILMQILKNTPSSILMSSFPGPQDRVELYGHEMLHFYFEGGYSQGPLGMGVSMLSQGGKVHITINPDVSIIQTKAKSEELIQCIIDEIYGFDQFSTV